LNLRTEISEKHISNIIKWKSSITPDTALKLEKVFWISSDYWNNLQKSYDDDIARIEEKKLLEEKLEIESEIMWQIWAYSDLSSLWFVQKTRKKNEKLDNLYSFFWVSSLKNILWIFRITDCAFKKSDTLNLNRYNLACWLRAWEIRIKDKEVPTYSKRRLEALISELKLMTKEDIVNIEQIQKLLESSGVLFSYIPWFKNVPVYWITRKYKWKPFIQISNRGKRTDTFWFALFHELAHVILHLSRKDDIFINIDNREEDIEEQANNWASNILINAQKLWKLDSGSWWIKLDEMKKMCEQEWIWMSILAWRLAFDYHNRWYSQAYKEVSKLRTPLVIG